MTHMLLTTLAFSRAGRNNRVGISVSIDVKLARTTVQECVEPEAPSRGIVILALRGLGIGKSLHDVPPRHG